MLCVPPDGPDAARSATAQILFARGAEADFEIDRVRRQLEAKAAYRLDLAVALQERGSCGRRLVGTLKQLPEQHFRTAEPILTEHHRLGLTNGV